MDCYARLKKFKFITIVVILVCLLSISVFAGANAKEKYRYAEKPWGLDTPAGRCVVCHSLEKNGPFRVAPNLYGIVGAEKARARKTYSYSKGLLAKGGTWTPEELDKFLEDANKFIPGSTKSIKVTDADERKEIIEFLKTLGG